MMMTFDHRDRGADDEDKALFRREEDEDGEGAREGDEDEQEADKDEFRRSMGSDGIPTT